MNKKKWKNLVKRNEGAIFVRGKNYLSNEKKNEYDEYQEYEWYFYWELFITDNFPQI